MPRFEFNWKDQPANSEGYKLIRTEVVASRDVLDAVLGTLPKGEHEFVDVEEVQRIKHEEYLASRRKKQEDKLKKNFDAELVNESDTVYASANAQKMHEKLARTFSEQELEEDSVEEDSYADSFSDNIADYSGSLSESESEDEEKEIDLDVFSFDEDDFEMEGEAMEDSASEDGEAYRSPNDDIITITNCYRKEGVNEWGSYDKVETIKIKRRNLVVDQFLSEND